MAALIHIENLSRHYGELCAVDNLSFQLQPGEVLGFLGPNGAGKSTTMQIICGTLAPSSGTVRLAGFDLLNDPIQAKRALGYLPEVPPLYPDMRLDEYLRFCARIHGVSSADTAEAVAQTKARCGLEGKGRRVIGNLSKGYKQRVGIAQAIIHRPRVIILDEPTSGLDPNQIREIRTLIRELSKESGILLSTHILSEVQSTCDRVLILHQGRAVYTGAVTQAPEPVLRLTLEEGDTHTDLSNLPGTRQVEPLEGCRQFRLILDEHGSPAEIAKAIVQQGGRLLELRHEQDNLERIFSQVTLGENLQ